MADSRGRGASRGRGGAHRGGRGGASDGRGGRGGGRGDDSRGGRGDYQRGRGGGGGGGDHHQGGRGDFRGGRGEFRGGGRGDSHGGRGRGGVGGRGGHGGYGDPSVQVFGENTNIPAPDPQVTALEDGFIRSQAAEQLASQMSRLSVASTGETAVDLPCRPAFGTVGKRINLWANYFQIDMKPQDLFRYTIEVTFVKQSEPEKTDAAEPSKGPEGSKGGAKPPSKGGKGPASKPKEAKGRKLFEIIDLAVRSLPSSTPLATEYKSQLISLGKLRLPAGGALRVQYVEEGRDRAETWEVKFHGPVPLQVDRLVAYLASMTDLATDADFPRFATEVDALNVILGYAPRRDPHAVAVGRGRFFATDHDDHHHQGGGRAEAAHLRDASLRLILRGYFQSVRPATGRLLLNANVTHGVFRKPGLLDVLFRAAGLDRMDSVATMSQGERRSYAAALRRFAASGLKRARLACEMFRPRENAFKTVPKVASGLAGPGDGAGGEHPPQFRFPDVFGGPATTKFYLEGTKDTPGLRPNEYVTVADYYKKRHGRSVNTRLPLVNVGTAARPVFVPAELCEIVPGQPLKTKLDPSEQDEMIRFACRPPPSNTKSLTTSARKLLMLDDNPHLASFGISVGKQLITVIGRELNPPAIAYRGGGGSSSGARALTPEQGSWLMKAVKVLKPGRPITRWACIFPAASDGSLIQRTASEFGSFLAQGMGINMAARPVAGERAVFDNDADLRRAFQKVTATAGAGAGQTLDFVLVVLPAKSVREYNAVKKLADCEFGVACTCVVEGKFTKEAGQKGYFANVGLKVNLKFGGANHQLRDEIGLVKSGKTMIVGYDVTHPTNLAAGGGPAAQQGLPSIVGLVASVDRDLAQWPAAVWNNPTGVEQLDAQLDAQFRARLRAWRQKGGGGRALPENIVIFRDGVSEGQFRMVVERELPHIRRACEAEYGSGGGGGGVRKPRIALVVSVKRHQTRFYPTDPKHMHARSKSPKEGTVVDRGVTNVRYWDFFLQAHASLQGTARPAHYTVLVDEIFRADYGPEAAADQLEKFTHDMCYLFGRATKAVSICPPAYYADLVCTRARAHKSELFDGDDTSSVASSNVAAAAAARSVHPRLAETMYYI